MQLTNMQEKFKKFLFILLSIDTIVSEISETKTDDLELDQSRGGGEPGDSSA